MSQMLRNFLLISPAILGVILAASTAAIAETGQPETAVPKVEMLAQVSTISDLSSPKSSSTYALDAETDENGNPIAQVTSVSQLSDVQPTDWAFQALQSLVERYGCIAGYPDGTFRGNRAATRYELAAALNACLDQLSNKFVTKEDLAAIKALQDEFAAELATLRGRVDGLEARTATLEAQQFSTTTKLNAEAIFSLSDAFLGQTAVSSPGVPTGADVDSNLIFTNRLRLNFDTSFTGKDRLRTRLQASNVTNYSTVTGTNMGRLSYDGSNNNQFSLARLEYRFPFANDNGRVFIEATGGEFNDNVNTFNPFFESSGKGALSRFGRFNPIYRLSGNTGATISYTLLENKTKGQKITAEVGYLAGPSAGPELTTPLSPFTAGSAIGRGGLGDAYGALAQIGIQPVKNLQFGLTYVHSRNVNLGGSAGSAFADTPFGGFLDADGIPGSNTTANSFGGEFSYQVSSKFTLSGWVGYTLAHADSGPFRGSNADILNYAVTLAFPDLLREGDVAGLIFGQPPKVINTDVATRSDEDTSYQLEGLYRFTVNDNISVTPGVIVVFNPQHNNNNDMIFIPVVRTTFTF